MITAQALEILQLKRPRIRDITRKFKLQTRTTWVQQVTPREKQFLEVGTALWWQISEESKGQNVNQLMTWWSEGTNYLHRRHTYDDHVVDDTLMTFSHENINEPVTPMASVDEIFVINNIIRRWCQEWHNRIHSILSWARYAHISCYDDLLLTCGLDIVYSTHSPYFDWWS